jgi:SAM-dependent methyltransferase/uncharacterized protein YbaR (Trm112 family)
VKKELLEILCCPIEKASLTLKNETLKNNEIYSGKLICSKCNKEYSIIKGIPVMLINAEDNQTLDSVEQWGFQWTDESLNKNTKYYDDDFLDLEYQEWNLPENWLNDKIILDAGCGNGRHTKILKRFKFKQCVAFDLSEAVYALADKEEFKDVHLVRADMALPPFPNEYFDFVLARQVLQHTKNPQNSIKKLAELVKKSGIFVGSLYKTPENFLTYFKLKFIGCLRNIFKIFPKKFIYYFTWLSIPFYKYKILKPLGRFFFIQSKYDQTPNFTWNLNHDQYIAGYQYTFTRKKAIEFFENAGLTDLVESKEWENLFRSTKK